MARARRGAAAVVLLALTQRAAAQTFVTSLKGLGNSPIGATPLNANGVSVMSVNWLGATDPEAVCNDGSQAGYYMAPATSAAAANDWLVYLEGSMFCFNGASCQDRYKTREYWMSSSTWATQMAQGGIFDPDTGASPFGDANRVYVKYCSSDLWSGDVPASDATWGFAFRGARIVAAVITSLIEERGMGAQPGTRLLFGGCSAGAIGAMNNLDAVARMVPPTVTVQGFLDAAALVDIDPTGWGWSPDLVPLQTLIGEMVSAITPTFEPSCAATYPGADAWKCLWGQYRMPLVQTQFFLNAPQFDDFEIQYETDNLAPHTPQQLAFVNSFQPAVLSLIASLPPNTGVFSPTCLVHCLSGQTTFQDLDVNGQSMATALSAWWSGAPTSVVSSCQGWNCVYDCGITYSGLPCNIGDQGCNPMVIPTETSDEPAPAGAPQPQNVQQQEPSLNAGQQQQLQQLQQQQQQQATSRRLLLAAEACCGHETKRGTHAFLL